MKKKNHYLSSYDDHYYVTRKWHTATNYTRPYEKNDWAQSATNSSYKNWAVKNLPPYDDYDSYRLTIERSPARDIIALIAAGDLTALKKFSDDLQKRIATNESMQWVAGSCGHPAILQFFCELGVDLREGSFNALRGAATHNQLPVIQWLHGNGLISAKNRTECLNLAAERGHIDIIKWLCANGASIHQIREPAYPDPKTRDLIAAMKREKIDNIVSAAIAETATEKPASRARRFFGKLGL